MENASFSILELFQLGGPIMWPLLLFSIAAIAIAIERTFYLIYHKLNMDEMTAKTSEYIGNNDYSGAAEYLSGLTERHMGARILLKLIGEKKQGQAFLIHRAERAAELEAINCIGSLENGFNFLVALGSLSPLTGFLGTVTGMIGAFRSIAEATEVNAQIVANGIYEALITTVFGLVIAIIAMVSHSILSHIVDRFASRVENACSSLIAQMDENPQEDVNINSKVIQNNADTVEINSGIQVNELQVTQAVSDNSRENIIQNTTIPDAEVPQEIKSQEITIQKTTVATDPEVFWENITQRNTTQKNTEGS
ncbi:MAG: MotA/TolQ/ExbB proton channel family protein [Treponema sp.]|nr:MotA/TolQ/ExbB proton channel family protein [Treponema sp.]